MIFYFDIPMILHTFTAMNKSNNENDAIEKFLLRINKDLKAKAETEAKNTDRSLNGHIIYVLKEDLKTKGVL